MRVNYDKIAHLYDSTPHRGKEVDPNLLTLLAERGETAVPLRILDLGCGTGSQLVANQAYVPEAASVGLDLFAGMLRQAQAKSGAIHWLQGNSSSVPFATNSFDYISNQFSFHHVQDKAGMLAGVYRVLRANGRFIMQNIAPREMPDWVYYHYFPTAYTLDLSHYLTLAELQTRLSDIGFVNIQLERNHFHYKQDLAQFLALVQDRLANSQLIAISDADYEAGLQHLVEDVANSQSSTFTSEICLITLCADKPGEINAL
jgi:ubiquinone/menaquinone biosynthesis C-methylase UbiE